MFHWNGLTQRIPLQRVILLHEEGLCTMEDVRVRRKFSPEIAEKLENIQEHELAELLGIRKQGERSKWRNLIHRIEQDSDLRDPEFQEAWKRMKEEMREWRGDFEFKNDAES
jgi:transposase